MDLSEGSTDPGPKTEQMVLVFASLRFHTIRLTKKLSFGGKKDN